MPPSTTDKMTNSNLLDTSEQVHENQSSCFAKKVWINLCYDDFKEMCGCADNQSTAPHVVWRVQVGPTTDISSTN